MGNLLSGQTAVLIWSQKVTQHQCHQTIWACLKEHWKVFPKGTLFFLPMRVVLKESLNVLPVPIIVLQQFAVSAFPIN